MALSDTAEYWQDVKKNYPYCGPDYLHIPNANCGHTHYHLATHIGDVNCNGCLKLIKEGLEHNLKEGKWESKSSKKRRLKHERYIKEQEELYGRCSCGSLFTLRTNSITKLQFLGCLQYPKCKNTKSIKLK